MATKKATAYKPPKSLAACADALYTERETRLGLNRQATEHEEHEKLIKAYVLDTMDEDQTGVMGKVARLEVNYEYAYSMTDPGKVYAFIVQQYQKAKKPEDRLAAFAILTKGISQETIKEMFNSKVRVPGMSRIRVAKISCTKRTGKK